MMRALRSTGTHGAGLRTHQRIVAFAHGRTSAAATTARDMLAIVPFEVMGNSGEQRLATSAPRLLGASLAREHVVSVFDPSRVRDALAPMDTNASPTLAKSRLPPAHSARDGY